MSVRQEGSDRPGRERWLWECMSGEWRAMLCERRCRELGLKAKVRGVSVRNRPGLAGDMICKRESARGDVALFLGIHIAFIHIMFTSSSHSRRTMCPSLSACFKGATTPRAVPTLPDTLGGTESFELCLTRSLFHAPVDHSPDFR